ncbi:MULTISPECIES: hypothetical protein [Chryseobacterium]|uniref:Flagellar biogenesis protein FliO n=1 Tax=Chryseobacterium camelliae TaxID=1265445 RepID=A0ABU0TMJ1_9FLAO|nr:MULTISPECIES: hypothetical protein [Chryseobacterium]MDT3407883.1 flagellar biogenesis protein FliO [Pseudacidovorax intermedius]MDQ1098262.1 flagellar biogenesis protein FliO [Chryseobacterium camelliae]MDQ1102188.1 flagellar biogenesis protein FliO [Chryseobacterium sp. SORGH_AS_1048]MDR6085626.1 flagellar biogenesis protein FliO [Chryseobacterium sp. SORGH_AS_0909]MDR6129990.1 flagellar biogenesis protein FliO [Chryseobacterium sp. SORGH_AS_1175]
MDLSLIIQYIIVLLIVAFACYALFRMLRKNFAPRKFSSKRNGCDKDCGCS